jgi:hypothetical protein
MTPVRLQLSRRRGFVLQRESARINGLEAVNVARPGRWGNPYVIGVGLMVGAMTLERSLVLFRETMRGGWSPSNVEDMPDETASAVYRAHCAFIKRIGGQVHERARSELRGRNLACWCELGDACHGDILLEMANS